MNSSTVNCKGQAKSYTRRSESWDLEDMVAEWCSVLPDVRREGIRCRLSEEEEDGKEPDNNWLQAKISWLLLCFFLPQNGHNSLVGWCVVFLPSGLRRDELILMES